MPAEPSPIQFNTSQSSASRSGASQSSASRSGSVLAIPAELRSWLQGAQLRVVPAEGASLQQPPSVQCRRHAGGAISVLQLSAVGVERFLFRNHPDRICLVFAEFGQARGSAGGRPFSFMPQRFSCMLLPSDVLQVLQAAPRLGALVVELPIDILLKECELHDIQRPGFYTLQDTVPGHEVLLIACARQLLEASSLPDGVQRQRISKPLELSILSLVASLVGSCPAREVMAQPAQVQEQHVQRALLFFEQNMASTIALTDVCKACNISARTLQASFQVVMQRTPLQALMELRLSHLRQRLLNGMEVRLACQQAGLPPSGRMAAHYKQLFGELPSQTRLKAP
jgi:AraC-like DNA-binding protein